MSEDGWLTIVGRRKDMIISGGENVYPSEVEPVLMRYPGIVSAVVYGLPDDQWGERVEATVVVESNQPLDVDHLRQWARQHIATYKVPKRVHIVSELPMTAVMKIDRVRTRELALEDRSGVTQ
jgi:fatty-acyl-CoA synthase